VLALSRTDRAPSEPGKGWIRGDLSDRDAVLRLVEEARPDVVFHLASLVTGKRDLDLVAPALEANLLSTVHLLEAATRIGVRRIVLAGSQEEPEPGTPDVPGSPYAAAKAASSLYGSFFRALYGTPVVTARIYMVYGPGQADTSKLVPATILSALAGERPRISSGTREIDWVYVEDVARGLVALARAEAIEGEILDLGSGELVTVRAIAERICAALGVEGPEVGAVADRPLEVVRRADPRRTLERTGWRPEIDLDEGLARTINHYRAELARRGS